MSAARETLARVAARRDEGNQEPPVRDTPPATTDHAAWLEEYDRTDPDAHVPSYIVAPALGPQPTTPTTAEVVAGQWADIDALCSAVAGLLSTRDGEAIAFWLETSPLPDRLTDAIREEARTRYRRRLALVPDTQERAA